MTALFKNAQWVATDWGMETVESAAHYEIEAERLTETTTRMDKVFYDWPVHMQEKTWINFGAFEEAFRKALQLHAGKYEPALDSALLDRSFAEAHRMRRSG